MGVELDFAPGPVIAQPIRDAATESRRCGCRIRGRACPTCSRSCGACATRSRSREIPLLGFAGAPFTLAAYLVEGSGSKDFSIAEEVAPDREPDVVRALLERLTDMTIEYLNAQVEAGAQAVQLFDTWAGLLDRAAYSSASPSPRTTASRDALADSPRPLILYVRMAAPCGRLCSESGASVHLARLARRPAPTAEKHGRRVSLQGNLDPCCARTRRASGSSRWVREMAEAASRRAATS